MPDKADLTNTATALVATLLAPAAKWLPQAWQGNINQLARFVVVGAVNTLVSYLVFVALLNLVHLTKTEALIGAYICGATFAYFSFGALVFGPYGKWGRFVLGYVALYFANLGMLNGLMWFSGWSEEFSQLLLLAPVALLSFLINRLFVFRGAT
jgi:putative flippase GtrA